MDSVHTSRNPQYIIDNTIPISSALNINPSYYRQSSNSPLQLSSEWADDVQNIASAEYQKSGSPLAARMSSLATQETPSKKTNKFPASVFSHGRATALTPHAQTANFKSNDQKIVAATVHVATVAKDVTAMDILWAMLNDLTGKDKMAKVGQYTLRLLLHYSRKTQTYLSDDVVNIRAISKTYATNDKVLDLLANFIRDPRSFAKILIILTCSVFTSRLAGFVPALGLYRQLLRFGKSPFRIYSLFRKVRENMYKDSSKGMWKISDKLFTKANLGECIGLYYNINDESTLLYKLKFLKNETWKSISSRHESYAWYCDSWFALFNAYESLQNYAQQELDMKITIQVKKRSRTLSKQVLGANSLQTGSPHFEDDLKDTQTLNDIQFQMVNARLDIYKTISDIIFNSYTVFNAKLHFDTIQIWMGISASFLSCVKLFRQKKKELSSR